MWTDVLRAALVCAGVIFIPGTLVACAARTRPLIALTLAAPLSVTIVAASSVFASKTAIAWGFTPVLLVTIASVALATPIGVWRTLRIRTKRISEAPGEKYWKTPEWGGTPWFLPAALSISATVHIVRLANAIGIPDAFSQTYDSPFHHNVIAKFLERGDASFLKVNLTAFGQENGFYPALWHQLASLNAIALGTSNTGIATNGLIFTVTGILWPIGVAMLLGWTMRSWNFAAMGGLFAFLTAQMPNHFTWFGVLYPNLLAYSLLSFYLAAGVHVFWGHAGEQRLWTLLLTMATLPGLAVAHPSGAISLLYLAAPILILGVWHRTRQWAEKHHHDTRVWPTLALIGILTLYQSINLASMRVASLQHMRTNEWYWQPLGPLPHGILKVAMMKAGWPSAAGGVLPALIGVSVIIGALYALRRTHTQWMVAVHALAVTLFLVAYSMSGPWRPYIIGVWYSDPERFAALTGVTALPLMTLGIYATIQTAWKRWAQQKNYPQDTTTRAARNVVILASLAVFTFGQLSPLLHASYQKIAEHMAFDTASPQSFGMLSHNELILMERLPEHVKANETIISNPWDGSVFAPAISGVNTVYAHVAPVSDDDGRYLAEHLNEAATDTHICDILTKRHITHVLDFGPDYLWNGDPNENHLKYSGLNGLESAGIAHVEDRQGNAKLLRITACTHAPQ